MDHLRFINALRIMWNLDRHHLVEAGVLDADDTHGWEVFRDYPHDAAIRLSDERATRLWTLVESRQPKADDKAELSESVRDAAPELLAELKNARVMLDGVVHVSCRRPGDRLSRIDAVIAKAEGRANG